MRTLVYRPRPKIDDWGMIRDDVDGNIVALVRVHNQLDEHALNQHRINKTDPCEEVGRQIVEACNNYESIQARCDRYKAALEWIAAMDYDVDGLPEHNEWAEALCFNKAQEISRIALEDTK